MAYRGRIVRCALCAAELLDQAQGLAGLEICQACHDGRSSAALIARGIHVQAVEESTVTREGAVYTRTHALGATGFDLDLDARFAREGLFSRVLGRDLKTGDKLFDDSVSIEGAGPALSALLAHEAVRLSIMDLVLGAQTTIERGCVRARFITGGAAELRRAVQIVAWGLWSAARALGSPRGAGGLLPMLEVLSPDTQVGLVIHGDRVDPRHLAGVPEVRAVTIRDAQLTSGDLTPLTALHQLESLKLVRIPQVHDLEPLAHLASLRTLILADCPVQDIRPLARLTGLRWINLCETRVTDLTPLFDLEELDELYLRSTPVDPQQVVELQQRRPGLTIVTEPA